MKKSKKSILLDIFDGSKLILLLVICIEIYTTVCVFHWIKSMAMLSIAIGKGNMVLAISLVKKICFLVFVPQILRYFIQMPSLEKIYKNINTRSKIIAYDHFSKININSLDESTYLRVSFLGEYINTIIFNEKLIKIYLK